MSKPLFGRPWGGRKAESNTETAADDDTPEDDDDDVMNEDDEASDDEADAQSSDDADEGAETEDDEDMSATAAERARWSAALSGVDLPPAAQIAVTALAETDASPETVLKMAAKAGSPGGGLRDRMKGAKRPPVGKSGGKAGSEEDEGAAFVRSHRKGAKE